MLSSLLALDCQAGYVVNLSFRLGFGLKKNLVGLTVMIERFS